MRILLCPLYRRGALRKGRLESALQIAFCTGDTVRAFVVRLPDLEQPSKLASGLELLALHPLCPHIACWCLLCALVRAPSLAWVAPSVLCSAVVLYVLQSAHNVLTQLCSALESIFVEG